MAAKKLSGKVAVVTGASKGIGAAIAQHFADEGASVVVNYSTSKDGAEHIVAQIKGKGGKAVAIQANVSKEPDIKRLFTEAKKAFGRLDILVNNAGVYETAALEHITTEHFHKHFDLNVLGLILSTKEAVKHMGPEGGSIINISSVASTHASPNFTVYSGTKAAVDAITKCLAQELAKHKIRVNAINPGVIETEGTHSGGFVGKESEFLQQVIPHIPLGRIGQPMDIAPAAVFLASNDSGWLTGEMLVISGGFR